METQLEKFYFTCKNNNADFDFLGELFVWINKYYPDVAQEIVFKENEPDSTTIIQ